MKKLLEVLHELVEQGNSVVVIEHNLEVIKTADWILDLGPEGGDGGGEIVVAGTPETVAAHKRSHTGHFLAEVLARRPFADGQKAASGKDAGKPGAAGRGKTVKRAAVTEEPEDDATEEAAAGSDPVALEAHTPAEAARPARGRRRRQAAE